MANDTWRCEICETTMDESILWCLCGGGKNSNWNEKSNRRTLVGLLTDKSIVLYEGNEGLRTLFIKQHMPLFGSLYSYGHHVYSSTPELIEYFKKYHVGVYGVRVSYATRYFACGYPWASLSMSGANSAVFDHIFTKNEIQEVEEKISNAGAYQKSAPLFPSCSSDWFALALDNPGAYFAFWVLTEPKSVSTTIQHIFQSNKYSYYRLENQIYRLSVDTFESTFRNLAPAQYEVWDFLLIQKDIKCVLDELSELVLFIDLWKIVVRYL